MHYFVCLLRKADRNINKEVALKDASLPPGHSLVDKEYKNLGNLTGKRWI
jgi:hypothetical protein